MKRIIIFIIGVVGMVSGATAQDHQQFFQLPLIPDSLSTLQQRSDYLVVHYWDFCDLKKAFSSRDKMAVAFDTYLTLMPHASATVVYDAVKKFMGKLAKQPNDMLFIGELAEDKLYSAEAEMRSEDLFLAFAREIVANKRVDKLSKLRYQRLVKVLEQSGIGKTAPEFDYTDKSGATHRFERDSTKIATILFINSTSCDECTLMRTRLDADIHTTRLIDSGRVRVVSITPTDPGDETWQGVRFPESWSVGAKSDIDEEYDMVMVPMFYLIDSDGKIVLKTSNVDVVIEIMSRLRAPRRKAAPAAAAPAASTEGQTAEQ